MNWSQFLKKKDVSINDSFDEMLDLYHVTDASNGLTIGVYCPMSELSDDTKYPLVIYIHGRGHGFTDESFINSGATYWATTEVQNMFNNNVKKDGSKGNNGAFILMPKISEACISELQYDKVQEMVQEFLSIAGDHVDRKKIYIMGGSCGGGLVWEIITRYRRTYAAAVPICASEVPSKKDLKNVRDLPIWVISAKKDPIINYTLNQSITWKRLKETTSVADKCRWTVFTKNVYLPDGSKATINHLLAKTIGYNLCDIKTNNVLRDTTTETAKGKSVTLSVNDSLIQWLISNQNPYQR